MWYSLVETRVAWEGMYVDLWSVQHFLSGVLVAYLLGRWLKFDAWLAFGISVAIATGWEVFEWYTKISAKEYFTNHITDILFAQLGYWVGYYAFNRVFKDDGRLVFFTCVVIFIIYGALGTYVDIHVLKY